MRLLQRQADLDAANASVAELVASKVADQKSLGIEKDLLAVSKNDLARMKGLHAANAVSISEVENAESNLLRQFQSVQSLENGLSLYPSKIDSAKAKVALAESVFSEAKRNVDRTEIKSQISGILSGVDLEVGQVVAPNQSLFQVLDSQRIEVEAQISLTQLKHLLPDSQKSSSRARTDASLSSIQARVISERGTDKIVWTGKPVRLSESVDSQTRTIGVVVEVLNPSFANEPEKVVSRSRFPIDGLPEIGDLSSNAPSSQTAPFELKPGTFCEVNLIGSLQTQIIALPRTAFDGDQVYIVDQERLRARKVVRGHSIGDRVIVPFGIKPGDKVVVSPPFPPLKAC